MKKYKCVYNKYKQSYELSLFTTNSNSDIKVIDWKSNPYIPDDNEFIQWSNSFENYCKNVTKNSSSSSSK